jgi:hypothetical protein
MNTFEWHFRDFEGYISKILSWSPDYVVPVAKKGCKLLKTVSALPELKRNPDLVKYRSYFELTNTPVLKKKIAVVDDATQYTSTLADYRRYFENLGATVRTFSFVGHEKLVDGTRWKEDEFAEIGKYLPEPVYQEYILEQSYHLLNSGQHFDLDHLVLEIPLAKARLHDLFSLLVTNGRLLFLEDYFLKTRTQRFSLDDVLFFDAVRYLDDPSIHLGVMRKIKFAYNADEERLYFSPLVFPSWNFRKKPLGQDFFRNVPFKLPFTLPERIDVRNRGALLRAYHNIYCVYTVSLAKAFVQEVLHKSGFASDVKVRKGDLAVVLGTEAANAFIGGVTDFLSNPDPVDFKAPRMAEVLPPGSKYNSFADVIDALKTAYEKKAKKHRTRVGVHHYIPYDALFKQVKDRAALSEDLDYYCDFGAIVPEIVIQGGKVMRGCRTGEPDSEYNWKRTRVLIPIAIEQFRTVLGTADGGVEPTALNKLLSNFTFDYPGESYHELHSLIGVPYTFGTLVHVYHRHKAFTKPSIYSAEKISPYYFWDEERKKFYAKKPANLIDEIKSAFDERQDVPYSEIITYFKLLARIFKHFKTVDILNMLSICREQNYFYAHVLHNVRCATEDLGLYLDARKTQPGREALRRGEENAKSAFKKLRLAKDLPKTLQEINNRFGREVEFIKALEKLNHNHTPFGAEFNETLKQVETIVRLQLALKNLAFLADTEDAGYLEPFNKSEGRALLEQHGINLPENLRTFAEQEDINEPILASIYAQLLTSLDALPREEQPLLATRLRNQARSQARNRATDYVYRNKLPQIALLYLDFSGLRNIPEPKEDQISEYYAIVDRNVRTRNGQRLYGGKDGDDAFTILFTDVRPALQCAQDIKKDFSEDLLLRAGRTDIKFGLCFTIFQNEQKENETVQCWGTAKDCCEFKGNGFLNRGDLLLSEESIQNLYAAGNSALCNQFVKLENARLRSGSNLYRFSRIAPIPVSG